MGFNTILAQSNVTGKVTDADGMPLPGVSVQEKGINNGVVTDFDGIYSIDIGGSNTTLVFSYVGMTTTERSATAGSTLNVEMASDTEALEEVVVVGYGTQRKSDVTG
ncbi:MAG: carboxypeptidase-like regulatory domain-containing protein, partial [Leeuwenhoekiella sp.]